MRTHKKDPSITVIMETLGSRPEKIVRAIKSEMAQTYKNRKLLIINYHPQRMQICGNVPVGLEIINADDVFLRHVDQHKNNLNKVDTDCWTIVDDDDYIDPNHLQDMVDIWNNVSDRTDAPLQVCGQNTMAHYDNSVTKKLSFKGWGVSLFERLTDKELEHVYKLFPANNILGDDSWIAWNTYFDKRLYDGKYSYHWDRSGTDHLSAHESNRGETEKQKFEQALNFWQMKIRARARNLEPVILN